MICKRDSMEQLTMLLGNLPPWLISKRVTGEKRSFSFRSTSAAVAQTLTWLLSKQKWKSPLHLSFKSSHSWLHQIKKDERAHFILFPLNLVYHYIDWMHPFCLWRTAGGVVVDVYLGPVIKRVPWNVVYFAHNWVGNLLLLGSTVLMVANQRLRARERWMDCA